MVHSQPRRSPADFIVPLAINGMEGRMLHIPASPSQKKREILFIYGHHSTLERWWGLMEVFSKLGTVTMPDLPGFGGMDSFYKIGRTPTIDAMADYMAAFVKWRYKRKKLVIIGMSFGFVVATRMLQRYPELTAKVELLVSLAGFAHHEDFSFSRQRMLAYRVGTGLLSRRPIAWAFRHTILTAPVLRLAYAYTYSAKHKFAQAGNKAEHDSMMRTEIELWHANHVQTHWHTAHQFMYLNNCRQHVDLPVWHIATAQDHFFNNITVEQHYRQIFTAFHGETIDLPNHAPSVIADAEMAEPLMPASLKKVISELP